MERRLTPIRRRYRAALAWTTLMCLGTWALGCAAPGADDAQAQAQPAAVDPAKPERSGADPQPREQSTRLDVGYGAKPSPSVKTVAFDDSFRPPNTVDDVADLVAGLGAHRSATVVVSTTADFLAALNNDTTIILRPGTYKFDADGFDISRNPEHVGRTYFQGLSNVSIVGLGTPPPHLLQANPFAAGLHFINTSGLLLYNLSVGHDGSCNEPALKLEQGSEVRVVGADLYGSGTHGIVTTQVESLEIADTRIHDCNVGIAEFTQSDVRITRSLIDSNSGLTEGFVLAQSQLEIVNSKIAGNELHASADGYLFALDTQRKGYSPDWENSEVNLKHVEIRANHFTALVTLGADFSLRDTPITLGQFPTKTEVLEGWWCLCDRARAATGFSPRTRCFRDAGDCDAFADGRQHSTASDLLSAGVTQRCRHTPGELPKLSLGGDWTSVRDHLEAKGTCRMPAPVLPTHLKTGPLSTVFLRPGHPPSPRTTGSGMWERLAPIRAAQLDHGDVVVMVEAPDSKTFRRHEAADLAGTPITLLPHDKSLPKPLRALVPPIVVTQDGITKLGDFTSAGLISSANGSYWAVRYAVPISVPALAVQTMPAIDTKIRTAPKPIKVSGAHWTVDRARRLMHRDWAAPPQAERFAWRQQTMPGTFPGGATHVIAVSYVWQDLDADGAIFTVNPRGEVIQRLACSGEVTLDGLVDLDGDGHDEILFSAQGIEDISHNLVRLTQTSYSSVQLFAFGH